MKTNYCSFVVKITNILVALILTGIIYDHCSVQVFAGQQVENVSSQTILQDNDALSITGVNLYQKKNIFDLTETIQSEMRPESKRYNYEIKITCLEILGTGFSLYPQGNKVSVEDMDIPVVSASHEKLYGFLPSDVATGEHQVKVTVGDKSASYKIEVKEKSGRANKPEKDANGNPIPQDATDTKFTTLKANPLESTISAGDSLLKRIILQDLSHIKEPGKYLLSKINEPTEIRSVKIIHERKDAKYSKYISQNFGEYFQYFTQQKEITVANRGEKILLAALIAGNNRNNKEIEIDVTLRNKEGIIKLDEPLTQKMRVDNEVQTSNYYGLLVFFPLRIPYSVSAGQLEIDITVKSAMIKAGENGSKIESRKIIEVENPIGAKITSLRMLAYIPSHLPFFSEEDFNPYEFQNYLSVLPGQYIRLYHYYAIDGTENKEYEIACQFQIKDNRGRIFDEHLVKGEIKQDGFDSSCSLEYFLPKNIEPGDYLISSSISIKDANNVIRTEGIPFQLRVDSYNPSVKCNTWAVKPTEVLGNSFKERSLWFLANAITSISKGKRVGFFAQVRAEGFQMPEESSLINWSINVKDRKGTECKLSTIVSPKKSKIDDINGEYSLYTTAVIPEQLATGPLEFTVEFQYDDFTSKSQNGIILQSP